MKRLTKKTDSGELTTIGMPKAVACYWKLKKYEDFEEELGIDLTTLLKAQKLGFYIINVFGEIEKVKLSEWRFNLLKKEVHRVQWNKHLSFSDYGKTWALKKEELEND